MSNNCFRMSDRDMIVSLIESHLEDDNTFSRLKKGYAVIGILTKNSNEVELKVISREIFYKEILYNNKNIKLESISSLIPYISMED